MTPLQPDVNDSPESLMQAKKCNEMQKYAIAERQESGYRGDSMKQFGPLITTHVPRTNGNHLNQLTGSMY